MAETFASLGRVEAIRQLFENSGYAAFGEPLCFKPENGETVVSASSLLLEGSDFNLVYFPLQHLGYKSVVCVTGQLFARLAHPRGLSVTLGVSAKLDFEEIRKLWDGVLFAAREYGYKELSLELVPSRNGLTVSMQAIGVRNERISASRVEPKTKDLICVTGAMGAAYLGQQVLEHKSDELEKYKMLVGAYLKPELSAQTLILLEDSGVVPACAYFVNRGLADAVLRLRRDTGLGAKIYAERIPFEGNSFAAGKDLDIDPLSAAMNGGDDCQMLFVIPISQYEKFRVDFQAFDIIGHLALPEAGAALVTPDGLEHELSAQGW